MTKLSSLSQVRYQLSCLAATDQSDRSTDQQLDSGPVPRRARLVWPGFSGRITEVWNPMFVFQRVGYENRHKYSPNWQSSLLQSLWKKHVKFVFRVATKKVLIYFRPFHAISRVSESRISESGIWRDTQITEQSENSWNFEKTITGNPHDWTTSVTTTSGQ